MKKTLFLVFVLFSGLLLSGRAGSPWKDTYKIKTVVIDAGHGGHDSGCLGASAKEKHVALSIALKLGKLIEETYPDIKVIYTRKTDVFVPLHERAQIANRNKADLFICIHLNAGSTIAYGAETYVMGLHKTEDNLSVAKRENAAILLEDDYKTQYDGFDPNSPEAHIIFNLYQNQYLNQSLLFASNVQDQMEEFSGRFNRGVKQAGFLVLYKTAMPSVLIECGFLSHEKEEKYLNTDKGQTSIATSIFRAFKAYRIDMESANPIPAINKPVVNEFPVSTPPGNTEKAKQDSIKPTTPVLAKENPSPTPKENPPAAAKESPQVLAATPKNTEPAKVEVKTLPEISKPENSTPALPVFYTVQVGASKQPASDGERFLKIKGSRAIACTDGYTRYVVGTYKNLSEAKSRLAEVKTTGQSDAFITAFKDNQRISLQEAGQYLNSK